MCKFCCYEENGKLYPREIRYFYAGYSEQLDVDRFDEYEIEGKDFKFCPACGRDMKGDIE